MRLYNQAKTFTITIGGKTAKHLREEFKQKGMYVSDYVESLMESDSFITLKNPEPIVLVKLKILEELNLKGEETLEEVYKQAQRLGYELCPAEVGPHLRLAYTTQGPDEYFHIAMNQTATAYPGFNHVGRIAVFLLENDPATGLWLNADNFSPDDKINLVDAEFIFKSK